MPPRNLLSDIAAKWYYIRDGKRFFGSRSKFSSFFGSGGVETMTKKEKDTVEVLWGSFGCCGFLAWKDYNNHLPQRKGIKSKEVNE